MIIVDGLVKDSGDYLEGEDREVEVMDEDSFIVSITHHDNRFEKLHDIVEYGVPEDMENFMLFIDSAGNEFYRNCAAIREFNVIKDLWSE